MIEVIDQIPVAGSTRFILVGSFAEAAEAAARANLALRDWAHIDGAAPLRVFELREPLPVVE